ncbi:hypothetical protein ACWFMI_12590 [Nocardiopsis terrae]
MDPSVLLNGAIAFLTLLLAAATVALAYSTHQMATHAKKDLEAQWRPVLAPGPVSMDHGALQVGIRNIGRGPALRVLAQMEMTLLGQDAPRRHTPTPDTQVRILAPGESSRLKFSVKEGWDGHAQLLLDYVDLADRRHTTAIVLQNGRAGSVIYDVRVWKDHKVTTHGDLIYPQDGFTDASPGTTSCPPRQPPKLLANYLSYCRTFGRTGPASRGCC